MARACNVLERKSKVGYPRRRVGCCLQTAGLSRALSSSGDEAGGGPAGARGRAGKASREEGGRGARLHGVEVGRWAAGLIES